MEIGSVANEAYVGTIRAHSRDVMSRQSPSPSETSCILTGETVCRRGKYRKYLRNSCKIYASFL